MGAASNGKAVALPKLQIAVDEFPLRCRLVKLISIPSRIGCSHTADAQSASQFLETGRLEITSLTIPNHNPLNRMPGLDE